MFWKPASLVYPFLNNMWILFKLEHPDLPSQNLHRDSFGGSVHRAPPFSQAFESQRVEGHCWSGLGSPESEAIGKQTG